jgi:hypothetical protein
LNPSEQSRAEKRNRNGKKELPPEGHERRERERGKAADRAHQFRQLLRIAGRDHAANENQHEQYGQADQ